MGFIAHRSNPAGLPRPRRAISGHHAAAPIPDVARTQRIQPFASSRSRLGCAKSGRHASVSIPDIVQAGRTKLLVNVADGSIVAAALAKSGG